MHTLTNQCDTKTKISEYLTRNSDVIKMKKVNLGTAEENKIYRATLVINNCQ